MLQLRKRNKMAYCLAASRQCSSGQECQQVIHCHLTCPCKLRCTACKHCLCLQGSLRLGLQLLLSEEAYSVAGLRPAVGRLANAMVALLGPELTPGSMAYDTCKSLIREMQVRGAAMGGCM